MELKLYTVVHPVVPGDSIGWRWAIHTDLTFHRTDDCFLGAAIEPTQGDAEGVLAMVLSVLQCGLAAAGIESSVVAHVLCDCPLTADIVNELAVL